MKIIDNPLPGVVLIDKVKFEDSRGVMVKTFHEPTFKSLGLETNFKECIFNISYKNSFRGMHYQKGEDAHDKVIHVINGDILDIVLNINKDSKAFGKFFSTVLSSSNNYSLYMSKDYAHGMFVLSDIAIVSYMTTKVFNEKTYAGVRWDSFGFNWPDYSNNPILNERDKLLPELGSL